MEQRNRNAASIAGTVSFLALCLVPFLAQAQLNANKITSEVQRELRTMEPMDQKALQEDIPAIRDSISSFNGCMRKIDQTRLAGLQRKKRAIHRKVGELCQQNKPREAQQYMDYHGRPLDADPSLRALRSCLNTMFSQLNYDEGALFDALDKLPACEKIKAIPPHLM